MNRSVATLGVTLLVVVTLLAVTQPAAAVLTSVSGPDQLAHPDEAQFSATVEIRDEERIPIEHVNITFAEDGTDGTVTVSFTTDGEIASVHATGDAGDVLDTDLLEQSIDVDQVDAHADFGYGYLSGTNERTDVDESFGYGYGYGYGDGTQPTFGFDIRFDSLAFAPGNYTMQLRIHTNSEAFESNVIAFEVLPDELDGEVNVDPNTLNKAGNGKWVTAYIELPDGDVSQIDLSSVELNGVPAVDDPRFGFVSDPVLTDRDDDGHDELMVKFDRDAVAETLEPGDEVTVTVTGDVGDTTFVATDTIRVIDSGGSPPSNNASGPANDRRGGPN